MHPKTRHQKLLINPLIKRWHDNLKARSEITADNYLRNLGLWLEWLNLTEEELIDEANNNYNNLKNSISDLAFRLSCHLLISGFINSF